MLQNINHLIGYRMSATDGEIGEVKDFYFDDVTWTIRYLVVKTGGWLVGRKVLISPDALDKSHWETGSFPVNLTKEQIRSSPDIDTEKPVYRQHEIDLNTYYPWENYWESGLFSSGILSVIGFPAVTGHEEVIKDDTAAKEPKDGRHLHSTQQFTGYQIHASGEELGYVDDYILDDQTWKLQFLVVNTRKWMEGKKTLISPGWIKEVQWENSIVVANLSIDSVKNIDQQDPSKPITTHY